MKLGLLFGTFNPIHNGHVSIALFMLKNTDIQKVLFVVSPQNPFKANDKIIEAGTRLQMVKLAISNLDGLEASDIELHLPRPNYTIDSLAHLKEKYPNDDLAIIMGSDNLKNFDNWKDHQIILDHHKIHTYLRPRYLDSGFSKHENIDIHKSLLIDISSSEIRTMIREGISVADLIHNHVNEYISSNGLYLSK